MTTPSPKNPASITEHEAQQVEHANAPGRQPVVFVHGLWLLPSSWDHWATVFEEAGYTALTIDSGRRRRAARRPQQKRTGGVQEARCPSSTAQGWLPASRWA